MIVFRCFCYSSYMTNSEWELVSYQVQYHEGWEPMGNYTELEFSLHIRRRPWFMLLNTVLPTAFIRLVEQFPGLLLDLREDHARAKSGMKRACSTQIAYEITSPVIKKLKILQVSCKLSCKRIHTSCKNLQDSCKILNPACKILAFWIHIFYLAAGAENER